MLLTGVIVYFSKFPFSHDFWLNFDRLTFYELYIHPQSSLQKYIDTIFESNFFWNCSLCGRFGILRRIKHSLTIILSKMIPSKFLISLSLFKIIKKSWFGILDVETGVKTHDCGYFYFSFYSNCFQFPPSDILISVTTISTMGDSSCRFINGLAVCFL